MLAHGLLSFSATLLKKIGFPGWPDPNLDWVSGFGGSVLRKKGACTSPLFRFLDCAFSGG